MVDSLSFDELLNWLLHGLDLLNHLSVGYHDGLLDLTCSLFFDGLHYHPGVFLHDCLVLADWDLLVDFHILSACAGEVSVTVACGLDGSGHSFNGLSLSVDTEKGESEELYKGDN